MKLLFYISMFLIVACGQSSNNDGNYSESAAEQRTESYSEETDTEEAIKEERFPDDRYTATVEYYNPNTGNSNTYSLEVEVENNTVTVIYFNNGGWLDGTHIVSGGELDDDGSTTIESDKGYYYTVTIDQ